MLLMYTEEVMARPDKDTAFIPWDSSSNRVDFIDVSKRDGRTQLTFVHYVNFDEDKVYKAMNIHSVIMSDQVLDNFVGDVKD